MSRYKVFVILLLSSHLAIRAQSFSIDYTKLGKEEADLAYYGTDKSAEAVVLFDIGKSYFEDSENNFKVVFERSTRIKIFSEAGLKWAEVEIPFYHEGQLYEKVYDIEGCTYNVENGILKMTPFNSANCHEEKVNDFWLTKKFALPDVKVGSIIQYRYKLSSDYKFNLRDWEFQRKIPTIYSSYETRMIPFYSYVWLLQGASKFDSQKSFKDTGSDRHFGPIDYKEMVYQYVMKNVPAFNDEEYITSIDDYLIKLSFQLAKITNTSGAITEVISTWADLVKELLKNEEMTKFAKKSEKLAAKLYSPDSLLNKTQKEKFDFILNFVKANFNWNKNSGKYATKSPNELLKDKFGNSADLNLFAIGLLNAAGIEAYPLILSTRENGKIKVDYPYLKFFNYLLISATVDGKNILSDATQVLCPNDLIPSKCLNDKGLLIKAGDVQWVSLQSNLPSEIQTIISIDSIGNTTKATSTISATAYDALKLRNNYGGDSKKIADRADKDVYTVIESSISVNNQIKKEESYIMIFNTSYKTEKINDKIYLSPFLGEPITENPLKQYSRAYPIDMTYPIKRSYNSVINIPEGYKVEFVPENDKILNDSFELNYNIKNDGKTINIFFNYSFKKSIYPPTEYQNIKYYFKDIIKKGNEKIVLVHN